MDEQQREDDLRKVNQGDVDALCRLLVEYHGVLHRRVSAALRNAPGCRFDASDVLQEAFIAAFEDLKTPSRTFSNCAAFYGWLELIVDRKRSDKLKKNARARRDPARELRNAASSRLRFIEQLSAPITTPSRRVRREEAVGVLTASLARLSDPLRETITLRFLESLSIKETALRLGVSETTVTSRCFRGIQQLRDYAAPLMNSLTQL